MTPKEYLGMPYRRIIEPDGDAFLGTIREFPGCIAIGDTRDEAAANLERVAEGWLISVQALGQVVPDATR